MKRRIATSPAVLLWALSAYLGYDGMQGVARQHAPGYPNAGQWHYYVHFPLIMLFFSVGLFILAGRLPLVLFVALCGVQIFAFIPFILGYGGGI